MGLSGVFSLMMVFLLMSTSCSWKLLMQQSRLAEQAIFSVETANTFMENEDDPTLFPYMNVADLDWDSIPSPYVFRVFWITSDSKTSVYEWSQTSRLDTSEITGYECLTDSCPSDPFKGIGRSTHAECIFDGSGSDSSELWNCYASLSLIGDNFYGPDQEAFFSQLWLADGGDTDDLALGAEEDMDSDWSKVLQQDIFSGDDFRFSEATADTFLENENDPDAWPFVNLGLIDWDRSLFVIYWLCVCEFYYSDLDCLVFIFCLHLNIFSINICIYIYIFHE